MKKLSAILLLAALAATSAVADIVYVTALCSNTTSTTVCGSATNPDLNPNTGNPVYSDTGGALTTAVAAKPDGPLTAGARYFSNSFSNSTPDIQGVTINPLLGVAGGVYRLYHIHNSANLNSSTTIILGVTNVDGCTLSFNQTDKFQRPYGLAVGGKQVYQFLGFVTNNTGATSPLIRFYFKDGVVNAGAQARLLVDTFKFALDDACLDVPVVGVVGPLGTDVSTVVVAGVTNVPAAPTKITVYQNSGAGFVTIGSLTTGIVNGNNSVPVTGLVKGAQVAATVTVNGVDGCFPTAGTLVGGGANPTVRLALSIRETASTGPVGAPGSTALANIHFLGASTTSGGAPTDSLILTPGAGWQTVTLSAGRSGIADSANAAGTLADGIGYGPGTTVTLRVYAYKTLPSGNIVYSATPAESSVVTSNDVFFVNWTWAAVTGATGYRIVKATDGVTWGNYQDVAGTSFSDDSATGWIGADPVVVTPTLGQVTPSIQWNAGTTPVGTTNIGTQWGILESLAFSIADTTDTGPYDLYIDNIQNGATVFQTFETAPANLTDYGFRVPGFSGSTSGNILAAPNVGLVVNRVADTGTKSFRVAFQWNATTANKWLRLTTSGVNNPQVNLDNPISIRLLLQPVGASLPAAPGAPTLAANKVNGQTVLSWIDGHRLQTAVVVSGPYTNVLQGKTTSNWTNVWNGNYLAPWTNNFTEPSRFFRLLD